jgi:hypothetical protein
MRKLNQRTYMNYGEKTIVSRCAYKDFATVFIRYDGVATNGVIEVYQRPRAVGSAPMPLPRMTRLPCS